MSNHAFTPDYTSENSELSIGIVTEGKPGYLSTPLTAENLDDATVLCDQLNEALGLSHDEWRAMVARSMGQNPEIAA